MFDLKDKIIRYIEIYYVTNLIGLSSDKIRHDKKRELIINNVCMKAAL